MTNPQAPVPPTPVPMHRRPLTAREVVNIVVSILIVAIIVAAQFPAALDAIGHLVALVPSAAGVTLTPSMVVGYGVAFLFGAFLPGSPVGRFLDWIASFFGGPKVTFTVADAMAVKEQIAPTPPRPERIPSSRTSGMAYVPVLAWLALGFFALVAGCSLLAGCGASALSTQARAATIVGVGLSSVGAELHDERTAALDACHDTDCESTTTSAWAPAVAAYESARTALTAWVDALDVARQAGEPDGDVLGALATAVSRLAREWNDLAAAIRALGDPAFQPPDLPPAITALLGAVGGAAS